MVRLPKRMNCLSTSGAGGPVAGLSLCCHSPSGMREVDCFPALSPVANPHWRISRRHDGEVRLPATICSQIVEPDRHGRACGVTFEIGRDQDETIGAGGAGEDRCPADRHRLYLFADDSYPNVIETPQRRRQLPGERTFDRAIGPVDGTSTQLADDSTSEEIVGAKATDGVSGQEHDRNASSEPQARGARGAKSHAVNIERPQTGHDTRCMVFRTGRASP